MNVQRITKSIVDRGIISDREAFIWDGVLKGFGLRITPAGVKTYVVQYRMGTGRGSPSRRFTIGKHGAPWTADTARTHAQALLDGVRRGIDPAEKKIADREAITIDQLCDLYLAEGVGAKKASTVKSDKGRITHYIRPMLGKKRVDAITRADAERLLVDVQSGKTVPAKDPKTKRQRGARIKGGDGTAAQCVILLGTMLAFAIRRGYRTDNPAHGIKKPKVRKMERFLSEQEITRLATALQTRQDAGENAYAIAALRLLMLTGCRRSEITGLRWAEVDLERGCLFLPDSKTGKKTVYLNAPARAVLADLVAVDGNPFVIVGSREGANYRGIDKVWQGVRLAAEMPTLRMHDLRHSFASVAAAGGMSLPIIGALLGHKDTATTARYAHLSADPIRAANEAIGARIASAMGAKSGQAAPALELVKAS